MCKYNYFNVKKQTAGGENFENFRCQICNFVKETLILRGRNFENFPAGQSGSWDFLQAKVSIII